MSVIRPDNINSMLVCSNISTPLYSTFSLCSSASISNLTSHSTTSPLSAFFWRERMPSPTPYSSASNSPPASGWLSWQCFTLFIFCLFLSWGDILSAFSAFLHSVCHGSQSAFLQQLQSPNLLPWHHYHMFIGMLPPDSCSFPILPLSDIYLSS